MVATLNGCVAKSVQRAYQFEKPKAAFAKLSGDCDNKQFEFTNSSSVATAALGYFWNFDDGSFSTAVNPKHVFDGFGTKNVKLIVTTEFGCKDSVTKNVEVKTAPVAVAELGGTIKTGVTTVNASNELRKIMGSN